MHKFNAKTSALNTMSLTEITRSWWYKRVLNADIEHWHCQDLVMPLLSLGFYNDASKTKCMQYKRSLFVATSDEQVLVLLVQAHPPYLTPNIVLVSVRTALQVNPRCCTFVVDVERWRGRRA